MPRRNKRWDGLSRVSNPRQSVELHQPGTFEGRSTDWTTAPRLIDTKLICINRASSPVDYIITDMEATYEQKG